MSAREIHIQAVADQLERLCDVATLRDASNKLLELSLGSVAAPDAAPATDYEQERCEVWRAAYASFGDRRAHLTSAWIDRLFETFEQAFDWHRRLEASFEKREEGAEAPDFEDVPVFTQIALQRALAAAGDFIDPHLDRLVALLREPPRQPVRMTPTARRDACDYCVDLLAEAGPRLCEFIPSLLDEMHGRHGWNPAPHLHRALAQAARQEWSLVAELRRVAHDEPATTAGRTALETLRLLGSAARSASEERDAFASESPWDRCLAIRALAALRDIGPETLACFEKALRDENVYVRCEALCGLRDVRPEPARFIPMLIAACDDDEPIEDASMPDAAVRALGAYGPDAASALPRLNMFLSGPIERRTADPDVVREAIRRIAGAEAAGAATPTIRDRAVPLGDDEPLFAVMLDGGLAYIDRVGAVVLRTRYEGYGEAVEFGPDGRAVVSTPGDASETFVIDRAGEVVFRSTWDRITVFREGRAAVCRDKKWGFVDVDGRVIVEPQYDSVTTYQDGLAGVELGRTEVDLGKGLSYDKTGRRGFIDPAGRVVIPIEFEHGVSGFRDGRAIVPIDGRMEPGLFDEKSMKFVPSRFGYIDRTGAVVIRCAERTLVGPFSEGFAVVSTEPRPWQLRHSYIDVNGNPSVGEAFSSAGAFIDGCAVVRRAGRANRPFGIVIDTRGRELVRLPYDWVENLGERRFAVRIGMHVGIVDLEARPIAEPIYDHMTPFRNGVAWAKRGRWNTLLTTTGKIIFGPVDQSTNDSTLRDEWV